LFDCTIGKLETQCDGQGTCTCFNNGALVGSCYNLINGDEFCFPWANCCTPLFEM